MGSSDTTNGAPPPWAVALTQGMASISERLGVLEADHIIEREFMSRVEEHMAGNHSAVAALLASRDASQTLAGQIVARLGDLAKLGIEATRDVLRSPAGVILALCLLAPIVSVVGVGVTKGDLIIGALAAQPPAVDVARGFSPMNEIVDTEANDASPPGEE